MPHTHTHTRRKRATDAHTWQGLAPQPSGRPTLGTECSSLRAERHRTWHVEPQKPQNSIRKPLECGNSNAGFAPIGLTGLRAWTTGPQDVHVFGYTAKPIIFSCYICISKKSNGTNPNSSTKDEHKFKNISV